MAEFEYDWQLLIIMFLIAVLGFTSGFGFAMAKKGGFSFSFDTAEVFAWETTSEVSCKSNSMGLTLGCEDTLYLRNVTEKKLKPGRIYTYQKDENTSVVHRFIMCLDDNCTRLVFKGDANRIGEVVNRSQIKYEVEQTAYKR